MKFIRLLTLATILISGVHASCQGVELQGNPSRQQPVKKRAQLSTDDSIVLFRAICKGYFLFAFEKPRYTKETSPLNINEKKNTPFIALHGNVQYEYLYRSFLDTPFMQKDISQHFVQTNLYLTVKENYPVRISFQFRQSNSPFFQNIFDANVLFNRQMFIDNMKNGLKDKAIVAMRGNKLGQLEAEYKKKTAELEKLKTWINDPMRAQQIVEERERVLREKQTLAGYQLPELPDITLPGDSFMRFQKAKPELPDTIFRVKEQYAAKVKQLESGTAALKKVWETINKEKKELDQEKLKVGKKLSSIKDAATLKTFMNEYGLNKSDLPRGYKTLMAVRQIGIGRNWIDYSDLTVRNISLTGLSLELAPSRYYFAVSAGRINYRYRDFVIKDRSRSQQELIAIRAGIGNKDRNNIIVTYYDGKRTLLNPYNSPAGLQNLERTGGISIENQMRINAETFVTIEVAKSSYPGRRPSADDPLKKIFNFRSRENEAFSLKLRTQLQESGTRINGFYRKSGAEFQSFNLYPSNVRQEAWSVKASQQFFKKQLSIEAGIRKNDFNSYFNNSELNSKIVFKSFTATLKTKKYPFISVGYYPASQLTMQKDETILESQYNTLNVIVSHSYRVSKISMNTSMVVTKFYNNGSDTGFIYYNAKSVTLNHYIILDRLSLQSGFGLTDQEDLQIRTLDQSASYQFKKYFNVQGGLKWSTTSNKNNYTGGIAGIGIMFNKLGSIQLNYEKSYLPRYNKELMPIDFGRVTYTRTF